MKRLAWVCALAIVSLAACGGTDRAQPAPGSTPPASPSPTSKTLLVYATTNPCPSSVCAEAKFDAAKLNDLWMFDVSSGDERRLTSDGVGRIETLPQFTGRDSVSFVEGAEEQKPGNALWEVPLAGGSAAELVRLGATDDLFRYDWSPDGSTVAMLVFDRRERTSLRLWSRADRTLRTIKTLPEILGRGVGDTDEVSVTWSPDGSRILVVDTFASPASKNTMWLVGRDGKDVVSPRDGTFGRWSKDGASIIYRGFDASQDWYRLEFAGDSVTKLGVPRSRFNPSVSPDGVRIALHDAGPAPSTYVFDLAAGKESRVGPGVVPLWISADVVALTDVRPCTPEEECVEGPTWRPLGTASRVSMSGGGTPTKLFDGWTLNADVNLY